MSADPTRVLAVRWRCPFCPRGWSRRATAVEHIEACRFNPQRRGCPSCAHFVPWGIRQVDLVGAYCAVAETDAECNAGHDVSVSQRFECESWTAKEAH